MLSPWALLPTSFPNPVRHVSLSFAFLGSLASFLYCVTVSPVYEFMTAAQKCSMSTSLKFSLVLRSVGLCSRMSFVVYISSGVSHTCFVRRFTASCDIIIGESKGIRFYFGVATNDSCCVAPCMCVRGERRCSGSGISIGVVAPGVLFRVILWCVLGVS